MRTVHFMARLWPMLLILLSSPVMAQDDVAELTAMLEHFLANADSRDVHEDFWADDLVYSSSSGLRFGMDLLLLSSTGITNIAPGVARGHVHGLKDRKSVV